MITDNSKMYSHIHQHDLHFHVGESHALYLTHTLRTFSQALIGLFVPIYIFTLDSKPALHTDTIISGILWVLLFYLARSIGLLTFMTTTVNFIFSKLNFKHSIFVSNIVLASIFALLAFSDQNPYLLLLAGLLAGLDVILYWVPYHVLFIRKAADKKGHFGKKYGTRILLSKIAGAGGPVLGGLIISLAGFYALYGMGIILIILSAIPILYSVHEHKHGKHNASQIFTKYIKDKSKLNYSIAFSADAVDTAIYSIFWPISLILIITSFAKVGFISSVSLAVSAVMAVQVGKFIDKHGAKSVHKIGVTINSLLYLPRIFLSSPVTAYAIDIADRINGTFFVVPINTVMYEHAKQGKHDSEFIIYREMITHTAWLVCLIFTYVFVSVVDNWRWIFLVVAIISAFTYKIHNTK